MTWLPLALFATGCFAAPRPLTPAERERALVELWRARQAETAELQQQFRGSLSGWSLSDLGRVAFVLEQARGPWQRAVHPDDRRFVVAAVTAQTPADIERNLFAMVNYVRLGRTASWLFQQANARPPIAGRRTRLEEIRTIALDVERFRARQLRAAESGAIEAGYLLTRESLGALGEPATYERLLAAYRAGEKQRQVQGDLTGLAGILAFLSLGAGTVVVIRRRTQFVQITR